MYRCSQVGYVWTLQSTAAISDTFNWQGLIYATSMYVAVAATGTATRIMTSPDAITWTLRNAPELQSRSIAYGNGVFVVVGVVNSTPNPLALYSYDGITWYSTPAFSCYYKSVVFAKGIFVAVGGTNYDAAQYCPSGAYIMTSCRLICVY